MSPIITADLDKNFNDFKRHQMDLKPNEVYEPKIATKTLTKSASAVVTTQGASYYHPLYEPTNLQLPTKLRECLIFDTPITMADGSKKKIGEVNIGDWVIDKNGNKGQVEDVIINDFEGDIFKLKIRTIKEKSIITGNHNVFAIKQDNAHCINKSEKIKFCQKDISKHCKRYPNCTPKDIKEVKCRVDELQVGDFLLSPIMRESKLFNIEIYDYNPATNSFDLIEKKEINKNIMRLFGYFLAEGSYFRREDGVFKGIQFSFNINEQDTYAKEVKELLEKEFQAKVNIILNVNGNTCLVMAHGRKLAELFYKHCGQYSKNKIISQDIMDCPSELQIELVKTIINGDGHIDKRGNACLTTASEQLANQIVELLKRCNIMSTLHREERNTGFAGKIGHSLCWKVIIQNNEIQKLNIDVPNVSKFNSNRRFIWNNYIVLDIESIEKEFYKGKVYNLTITPEHSYIANDVAVANCNQWARYFMRTDPLVNNAIQLHSEFPITGMRNVCDDKGVQKFFDNLAFDTLKLQQFCSFFALEYFKLGNVFPMGIWDDSKGHWGRFITLNPDYVEVEKNIFSDNPILRLDPDDSLKNIVANRTPIDIYNKLDPNIIAYISKGQKVPLSNFRIEVSGSDNVVDMVDIPQVTHVANSTSMYESYGMPFWFCVFKVLMYKDILRRAQFSIARRHWKPVKVVKVGDETHHADNATLTNVKEALDQASADPDSWFIWHNYVNFDYIASAGKTIPLDNELKWVNSELYAGLGVNEAILTGGGVTFANASIALRIMVNKYKRFQKLLSDWIIENVYKPVAKVQQFYRVDKITGEQELIIPHIEWEMMRLQDDAQQKNLLQQLQQKGIISKKTLLTYIGIDYDKEKEMVKQEMEEDLLYKKEVDKKKKETTPVTEPAKKERLPRPEAPLSLPEITPPSAAEELPLGGGMAGETRPPESSPETAIGV